ncbi:MAG: AAA family ATPase [Proteobacteria bacterium]|nr:AAA family ATPase [Pseudomonadota bacterium]
MSYYKILGLTKEPFSTSPDPSFLYLSRDHKAALCRLKIAISLKRGMSLILGDVGTGKTSLSRKLAQELRDKKDVFLALVLNPYFESQKQFLHHLAKLLRVELSSGLAGGMDVMEAIEKRLFKMGVEENRTVVLLIDEAQILPDYVFEILRILLNYETNEYKMLQVVLLGQMELLPRINSRHNFWDRIALKYFLNPFDEKELAETINFRLAQAGYQGNTPLFTYEAVELIHVHTRGYPRKFTLLCHNALESLVMYDKKVVDKEVIQQLIDSDIAPDIVYAGRTVSVG